MFKRAIKYEAKGRVALIGPAGSGKSFTALTLAKLLAGAGGKIAAIDTEHGSLSKYADLFEFDVMQPESFTPQSFTAALADAAEAGYQVLVCDSLSHFWMGKDGALEFVDERAKRSGSKDSFSGWKEFRPHERAMIDAIIASPMHVIVTMRTKNEYVEEVNERGKKVRRKIGLAPVQREGMEYEFDLVGLMDEENTFIVDKTRCSAYAGKALAKPTAAQFQPFSDWLKGAEAPKPSSVAVPGAESWSNTRATTAKVLGDVKVAALRNGASRKSVESIQPDGVDQQLATELEESIANADWMKKMTPAFEELREALGDAEYQAVMDREGYPTKQSLMKAGRAEAARVYRVLNVMAVNGVTA